VSKSTTLIPVSKRLSDILRDKRATGDVCTGATSEYKRALEYNEDATHETIVRILSLQLLPLAQRAFNACKTDECFELKGAGGNTQLLLATVVQQRDETSRAQPSRDLEDRPKVGKNDEGRRSPRTDSEFTLGVGGTRPYDDGEDTGTKDDTEQIEEPASSKGVLEKEQDIKRSI
jgi:hypothetical protein